MKYFVIEKGGDGFLRSCIKGVSIAGYICPHKTVMTPVARMMKASHRIPTFSGKEATSSVRQNVLRPNGK